MEYLASICSLSSIPAALLGMWGIIRQINKEQKLNLRSPLVGMLFSPMILAVNVVLMRQVALNLAGPLFLILGLGFGLAWGMSMRLSVREGLLIGKQSILHLLFWGLSYAITQGLAVFAPASWVAGGLVLMFFSTGATLGTNLNLIIRTAWHRLRAGSAIRNLAESRTADVSRPRTIPR